MRMRTSWTLIPGIIVVMFASLSIAQQSHIDHLTGNAKRGGELYQRYCVSCHGPDGDGNGESAPYLDPKPRDFTKAVFKCRSTPSGTLPLDSDLYDTISRGVHSSGMPSWKPLTRQERADLVAYVKSFSPRFVEEKLETPVPVPAEPATSSESVKRGAELFQTMNCFLCHGKEGRGNGPSAASLTDSKGFPIRPFDLTSGKQTKCGNSDSGIFRDLMTGIDGTPMPSFADALRPDQVWDLVHFIATLREGTKGYAKRAAVEAQSQ